MDIMQNLGSLLGQTMGKGDVAAQRAQSPSGRNQSLGGRNQSLGGFGELLTPAVLGGLASALFPSNKTGGHTLGAAAETGDSGLGGMLGSLLSGAMGSGGVGVGGLGALTGLMGSLIKGGGQSNAAARQYVETISKPEEHAKRMLRTVIYAAKADGHIDAQEQAVIASRLGKLNLGPNGQSLVNQILQEPVNPAAIASGVVDPREAVQIYALSCALTNMDNSLEIGYLNSLASALRIPSDVKAAIEAKTKR